MRSSTKARFPDSSSHLVAVSMSMPPSLPSVVFFHQSRITCSCLSPLLISRAVKITICPPRIGDSHKGHPTHAMDLTPDGDTPEKDLSEKSPPADPGICAVSR